MSAPPDMPRLDLRGVARRRLANTKLIGSPFASPLDVVRRLGAVQAQDYAGAKWGVALRTAGASDADIERALSDGTIVRTHVLRPTWHLVAAEDIRWMLALTAPRVRTAMGSYDRKLELDDKVFSRSAAAITRALSGGKALTRTQLGQVLARVKIDARGQRLAHLMMRAELDALVCSGPRAGKQTTYALLDERIPPTSSPRLRDEALSELAMRYFPTRGPATVHDFAWWSGLTIGDARRAVEATSPNFERADMDGRTHWFTGEAPAARASASTAHLIPNYDEYFIGMRDRGAIGVLVKESPVQLPGSTFATHLVIVDGQLVGGWDRTITERAAIVHLRLAVPVARRHLRSIEEQALRYGEFLALPVSVEGTAS